MRVTMAAEKCIVLICIFSWICCGLCQLNLSEGSYCLNHDISGTCVKLHKCGSAVLTYLYHNAGFANMSLPKLPELCSLVDDEPVVCCTDCTLSNVDAFSDSAVAPYGVLISKKGPKAWKKCVEYFHKLPYPCRGKGNVLLKKSLEQFRLCYTSTLKVTLNIDRLVPQKWRFPHLALLGYGENLNKAQWLCEGTVISERFILTAARCTTAGTLGTVTYVSLGVRSNDRHKNPNIYKIKRVFNHPKYNEPSWYHDIALLQTEQEIHFNSDLLPACLDVGAHDTSIAETAGIVAKFANKNQSTSRNMESVYLDKTHRLKCKYKYRPNNNLLRGFDVYKQMCYEEHIKTGKTCKRLSGSPLQVDQFRCQYTAIGVTGEVVPCGSSRVPDIFTRVFTHVPWIESIVWPHED
nr:serine protease snake-like [Helicoverpa armigera]